MSFSRHQEQAERAARRLRWLHGLASVAVLAVVDLLVVLLWHGLAGGESSTPALVHGLGLGGALALIVGGAWLEGARLREDGALIARRLGAVAVDTVGDPLHRRLQNLLEELAITARIGVPRAFVLEDEPAINALTAGLDRNQAVVVVTRGALACLTRDELHGVLAHEVSHIVNGDVRLNTRLIGLTHGLQVVALLGRAMRSQALHRGRGATRTARVPMSALPLLAAGGLLVALGSIGAIAARAVQAGIGREREYCADAQAIELTRQRDGLGGALRKVAGQANGGRRNDPRRGTVARHPYWRNVAHLLLAGESGPSAWLDTHPPLRERIRRLCGADALPVAPRELAAAERREPELPVLGFALTCAPLSSFGDTATGALTGTIPWIDTVSVDDVARAAAGDPPPPFDVTPPGEAGQAPYRVASAAASRLVQATREPAGAAALVVALIEAPRGATPRWDDGWASAASRHGALRAAVDELPVDVMRSLRWPLIELAVARLRVLSRPTRESLLGTVRDMVAADGHVTLREWIYFGLLRLRLAPQAHARRPAEPVPADARSIRVLFAMVAHCAHVSEIRAERAANAAIRALGLDPIGGSPSRLTLESLERAVQSAGRLPPLDRPLLVRQLVALLPADAGTEVRDFLRLLCVAIDCPSPLLPPGVEAPVAPPAAPPAAAPAASLTEALSPQHA